MLFVYTTNMNNISQIFYRFFQRCDRSPLSIVKKNGEGKDMTIYNCYFKRSGSVSFFITFILYLYVYYYIHMAAVSHLEHGTNAEMLSVAQWMRCLHTGVIRTTASLFFLFFFLLRHSIVCITLCPAEYALPRAQWDIVSYKKCIDSTRNRRIECNYIKGDKWEYTFCIHNEPEPEPEPSTRHFTITN